MSDSLKQFYMFLEKHNALIAWETNLLAFKPTQTIAMFFNRLLNVDQGYGISKAIYAGFIWDNTPEGYSYWSNLNTLWTAHYNQYKSNKQSKPTQTYKPNYIKIFRAFLKVNGVLKEFDEQFKKEELRCSLKEYLKLAKLTDTPHNYLSSTIVWANIPSGYSYWNLLNTRWSNELASHT